MVLPCRTEAVRFDALAWLRATPVHRPLRQKKKAAGKPLIGLATTLV
jgi:hypothetical protein